MKYLTMTGFTVRTGSDRWTLGYEGENNSRTLKIKTTDDLTGFATVNLLIDTLDCGAMTVETVSNYKVLSMVLTAGMLGEAGMKTCQLLMMDAEGTVIKKTNQFLMVVGVSNVIEGTVPDSPVIVVIGDYVEEKVDELLDNVKDQIALIGDKLNDNALVALNRYKSDLIAPNFSIKAFKTLNYTDGTTDKYAYVLWNDETTDTYYISENLYSVRHKVFDWDATLAGYDSSFYQALILPNGDILFVFQTQFINASDDTAEGAYRRNPIICRASNGFRLEVIDFGSGVKPTGWLQNVGAIYSYAHNRIFIAEYTRANEKYARIWAVDMPVTTISNWHIVLEKEIPTPYQTGFKHFHSCQQDSYTGILYFSSGDNDLSSAVWYSTDGGDTLVQLDDYNAGKYRMLNMAFTKEYVYWASDQWSPNHFLWRIARDESTGVLDVSTLTKLVTFNDERVNNVSRIATYTTVYMSAYNCLLILDRDDGGIHPKIPVRVYDIPSGNLYTVAELLPITSGVTAGFRNVAVTCCTKSNEVVCSFDKRLLNNNRMLGNNSTNRINNLVMRLYKSNDAIQKVVTPSSWTDGYIGNNGGIASSDKYKYSSPFDVEEGRISVELTDDNIVAVLSSYDEQSNTYTPLVIGVGTGVHKVYEYNVTNPGKYVVSYRVSNGIGDIKVITKDASYRVDFDTVY